VRLAISRLIPLLLLAAPAAALAPTSAPIPEPGTLMLVGTGLVGVALTARLRRRREAQRAAAKAQP
jgi:hypothetical protein